MIHLIPQHELDRRLDPAAKDPERFETIARDLIAELDADNRDLELADPWSWRGSGGRRELNSSLDPMQQFRAEVDDILQLDRDEEARLARRIDFARMRLQVACEREGLDPKEALSSGTPRPRDVARRALELQALRTEMVERNLYPSTRYDLIQEGSLALFRAVDGFDWKRGLLFRTYAVHWLNQAFRNHLYNRSQTVRVPVYLQKAMKHINLAKVRLGDPDASAAQIAAETDLTEAIVATALAASKGSISIDANVGGEEGGSRLGDLLAMEAGDSDPYSTDLEDVGLDEGIQHALSQISDRERQVITMRFGLEGYEPHTLASVAAALGVSVERVRQIQVRALSKMDTPLLRRELDPFLN